MTEYPAAEHSGWRNRNAVRIGAILVVGMLLGSAATIVLGGPGRLHRGPVLLELIGPPRPIDPQIAERHAIHLSERLAAEADVAPEQRQKLSTIILSTAQYLSAQQQKLLSDQLQFVQLLTSPTISEADIDRVRDQQARIANEARERFSAAIVAAAETLSAEQRKRLADHASPMLDRLKSVIEKRG